MADSVLSASALSSAITFKVQQKILENLRDTLLWDDDSYSERGTFLPGFDTLRFVSVPDINSTSAGPTLGTPGSLGTNTFVEGGRPDKRALTISTVDITTAQYGGLISVTDIAKVKSPFELVSIASERLSYEAAQVLDTLNRNVIAAGGTAFYANSKANRAALASTDKLTMNDLRKLRATMYKGRIPTFADGFYRIFISAEQGFDLRNDTTSGSNFVEVNKYATPETILKGELGRLEGFRIMETTRLLTAASTTTVHLGIAVGALKGWGCGDLQTLQTYHVAPGGDHTDPLATEELVGWKVNYGCAVLSSSRYYRVESAATTV